MRTLVIRRNLHLIISGIILIPASLLYGLYPEQFLPRLFEVGIESVDLRNIFRALMFLYLGIAGLILLGVVKAVYWKFSTLLTGIFMGCLALGRILSLFIDGRPADIFVLGLLGELILSAFSFWQMWRFRKEDL